MGVEPYPARPRASTTIPWSVSWSARAQLDDILPTASAREISLPIPPRLLASRVWSFSACPPLPARATRAESTRALRILRLRADGTWSSWQSGQLTTPVPLYSPVKLAPPMTEALKASGVPA